MNYASRHETWERCWSESGPVPVYFSEGELEKLAALRSELYEKYLCGITEVSEFGAGTGHNLVPLIGTGRRLRAFDWSMEAVKKCNAAGLEGGWFDMLHPRAVRISGAAITVHALEQLGRDWGAFLAYLCANKPLLCIHIEPIEELYDDSPRDQERLAYHRARGYLSGFLTRLRDKVLYGSAEFIEVRKSSFGGKDHDAYSVIVWRPL